MNDNYKNQTTIQIKAVLNERDLPITGSRDELIERLEASDKEYLLNENRPQIQEPCHQTEIQNESTSELQKTSEDQSQESKLEQNLTEDFQQIQSSLEVMDTDQDTLLEGLESYVDEGEDQLVQDSDNQVLPKDDYSFTNRIAARCPELDMSKEENRKLVDKLASENEMFQDSLSMRMPATNDMHNERVYEMRSRSVLIKPVSLTDLGNELLQTYLEDSQLYFFRFDAREKSAERGTLEIQFYKYSHAKVAAAELATLKDGIEVKHLSPSDSGTLSNDRSVRSFHAQAEQPHKRLLFIKPVPSHITSEDLLELFPGSIDAWIPCDTDSTERKPKGYAYIEYESETEARQATLDLKEVEFNDGSKVKVHYYSAYDPLLDESRLINNKLSDEDMRKIDRRIKGLKKILQMNTSGKQVLSAVKADEIKETIIRLEQSFKRNSKDRRKDHGASHYSQRYQNQRSKSNKNPDTNKRGRKSNERRKGFNRGNSSRRGRGEVMNLLYGLQQLVGSGGPYRNRNQNRGNYNNQESYNQESYNQDEYNNDGYNQESYNQESYNQESYNQSGYNQAGYNQAGYNQASYNQAGYNQNSNQAGYSQNSYNQGEYSQNYTNTQQTGDHSMTSYNQNTAWKRPAEFGGNFANKMSRGAPKF